jgi:uncharacterized protein
VTKFSSISYLARLVDRDLESKLSASSAVLIVGPKSCGKSETAKQYAKSLIQMDIDKQVPMIMATNPKITVEW